MRKKNVVKAKLLCQAIHAIHAKLFMSHQCLDIGVPVRGMCIAICDSKWKWNIIIWVYKIYNYKKSAWYRNSKSISCISLFWLYSLIIFDSNASMKNMSEQQI